MRAAWTNARRIRGPYDADGNAAVGRDRKWHARAQVDHGLAVAHNGCVAPRAHTVSRPRPARATQEAEGEVQRSRLGGAREGQPRADRRGSEAGIREGRHELPAEDRL